MGHSSDRVKDVYGTGPETVEWVTHTMLRVEVVGHYNILLRSGSVNMKVGALTILMESWSMIRYG